ncbi:MAG: hypothetical protein NTZ18_01385 [Candidatus Komeilibacteria bacterium]|nr:hypothetical protein [Candidatus Komeilibacteria bacterium]
MFLIEEISQELKTIDQSERKLKQFSLIIGPLFILIGLVFWYYNYFKILSILLFVLGGLLIVLFWHFNYLKPLHWLWMALAMILGYIISRLLLIFIFIIVPISILRRWFSCKVKLTSTESDSYWQELSLYNDTPEQMERLF